MDISQLLPFLLKGDDNDQKSKLLSAMLSGGKQEDILASMAGGGTADILSKMKGGGGGSGDMMALMNMLKAQQKKTPEKKFEGLKTISDFAPPDILGTMYKMLTVV